MTLLAILAHPDDESFFCAGTLARYAALGHPVYLICATRGEQGEILHPEIDPVLYPKGQARGKLRQDELNQACRILGIKPPIFLDYQDSGHPLEVARANPHAFMHQEVAAVEQKLLEPIAMLKPEVILTFDPQGIYGHIDHILIHRAATAAFWSVSAVMQPAPRRLLYPLRSATEDGFAAIVDVRPYAQQIRGALLAHRSQVGEAGRFEQIEREWPGILEQEKFVLGGLRGSFPAMPADDLLEGLR